MADAEPRKKSTPPAPKETALEGGRLRRTFPLVALSARTAGESIVVGLR